MYSMFEVRRSVEEWRSLDARVWLTWAVFDPHGPTLHALGAVHRDPDEHGVGIPGGREIFLRRMHFLGGQSYVLGYQDRDEPDESGDTRRLLARAFAARSLGFRPGSPLVDSVPSWVCTGDLPGEPALQYRDLVATSPGIREADWGRERYLLDTHGADLFERAREESRMAIELLKALPPGQARDFNPFPEVLRLRYAPDRASGGWRPSGFEPRPLGPDDVAYWWSSVTHQEFLVPALRAFARAWTTAPALSDHALPVRETFGDVREFLAGAGHPLWPAEWADLPEAAGRP